MTGHSLGAGQAVYGAYDLALAYPSTMVTAYSFGTPRPGDKDFAAALNATKNLELYPVAHRADTVPQCGIHPAPCDELALGLHQVARNVWYPDGLPVPGVPPGKTPPEYVVCDGSGEDPGCQDSVPQKELNWADHDYYLRHAMWCCNSTAVPRGSQQPVEGCSFPF